MRVSIAGAGPAGLYAAILIRRARPDIDISIFEQNGRDATFGFGVVFSDQALGFLRDDDPETAALIEPHMQRWSDIAVVHANERIAIDGVGFAAIGRLDLLKLLQQRAAQLGIQPVFDTRVASIADLPASDSDHRGRRPEFGRESSIAGRLRRAHGDLVQPFHLVWRDM